MFHVKPSTSFQNRLQALGLLLSDGQCEALEMYAGLLLEWNTKVNLISRRDEGNVWNGHILHSLSPLFHIGLPDDLHLLDLGSGGGLPGIPLAIARPGWRVTLMDSIRKKCAAVEEISARLGLDRVSVVTGRAEDEEIVRRFGRGYDIVAARGVAPLVDLVRWSRPYVRPGAGKVTAAGVHTTLPVLLAYKGGDLALELKAMKVKGGCEPAAVVPLVFKGEDDGLLQDKKLVLVGLALTAGRSGPR